MVYHLPLNIETFAEEGECYPGHILISRQPLYPLGCFQVPKMLRHGLVQNETSKECTT